MKCCSISVSGQIYAEAESNADLFAIAEAQQYKWPADQIRLNQSKIFVDKELLSNFMTNQGTLTEE